MNGPFPEHVRADHRETPAAPASELPGQLIFASAEEQEQRSAELLGAGAALVTMLAASRTARGHLGEILEELVERELARLGAPSPYLSAWSATPEDAYARLADQLFRAKSVGSTGLAIALGSLAAIARPQLTPEDSATLRWLADITRTAPLVLLIDDGDARALGYGPPLPLGTLLYGPPCEVPEAPHAPAFPEPTLVDAPVALGTPPEETPMMELVACEPIGVSDADAECHADDIVPCELDNIVPTADVAQCEHVAHVEPADRGAPIAGPELAEREHVGEPEPVVAPEAVVARGHRVTREHGAPPPQPPTEEPEAPSGPAEPRVRARRRAERAERSMVGIPRSGANDAWRTWTIALSGAKGAQPLAAFERLFAESYVPLANAIASGLDDGRALRAYDEFRRSFERSYTDAFATFGATNRRPRLVMDAFDLAMKQARLAQARTAHVLVVDSMRFDLGQKVRDALATAMMGKATLLSESILWSALPSTTMRQLETLARGIDALRAPAREEPSESLRGRAAETLRRVRVGSRELHKLDLVPAMLESAEPNVLDAFDSIGQSTALAIARHFTTLHDRTLVYVLGDHGFTIDRRGAVHSGGASPEEVLVPAQAWLLGDLH